VSDVRTLPALRPEEDLFLARAVGYLERPSFLMKVANAVGVPIEAVVRRLPFGGDRLVGHAVHRALRGALTVAVRTLPRAPVSALPVVETDRAGRGQRLRHDLATALTGAVGGVFGLPGLVVELPVTTSLMLRAIAATASWHGEDLDDPAVRLECLSVLSHGRPVKGEEAMESSYLATRGALAQAVQHSARFVARTGAKELQRAIEKGTAPALVRLVATIAARFDIVVTEKLVAGAIPLIGAAGGAAVNLAFTDHFNAVARYHFGIRRLERERGADLVQAAYRRHHAALRGGAVEKRSDHALTRRGV
jgi:hypothetical protein